MSEEKPEKKQKSNKKLSDKRRHRNEENAEPDGSLSIARGMTRTDASKLKAETMEGRSEEDKARIGTYLEGPHSHAQKQRMSLLKEDDANMKMDNLNDAQKRALTNRRTGKSNRVVQHSLERRDVQRLEAAVAAADAQIILHTETPGLVEADNDMERTTRLSQVELKSKHLSEQTARHIYDFQLQDHAPYGLKYDRSGRCSILYGSRGHVALMDNHTQSLVTEFHLPGERIRDACFLHNATMLCVAQTNHAYIYDDKGAEIHRLQDHIDPFALDFLPHHWLLVSIGRAGWLKYHDTSTGELVSQHRSQQGATSILRQNPANAVMHVGHKNGSVTLWSPASSQYLVKLQCYKGSPITSLAVAGNYMVTGGSDRQVKIWDLRMYKETHAYYTGSGAIPTSLDISQRGLLGIGHGSHATVWESVHTKHKDPYMHHAMPTTQVETLRFRPFEDVCGIGHSKGISSIVIPGSGEPNLDTSEYNINPFSDTKQRREMEVRSLMDKLSANMISLDPDIVGTVEASDPHLRQERLQHLAEDKVAPAAKKKKSKKRGRSKIQTQLRRKARNVVDGATLKLREARDQEQADRKQEREGKNKQEGGADSSSKKTQAAPAALQRFFQ
jgi:U3 small nucleolar RNA-associated protein 7